MPRVGINDAGCMEEDDLVSLWLHLYVMRSRATSPNDLLLIGAPMCAWGSDGLLLKT